MVSFVEQATLKVNDQSSAEIKRINAALKSLFKTADKLKGATANLQIKTKGLAQATTMVGKLAKDAKALQSSVGSIRVNLNTTQAQAQLARLRAQAQQPIRMPPPLPGGGGRGGGFGGGMFGTGGYRRRGFAGAALSGAALGFGIPIGGLTAGFAAVEVAARAAAEALSAVATAGIKRDRTSLQGAALATEAQRQQLKVSQEARQKANVPFGMTRDESERLVYSLLGDIPGVAKRGETQAKADERQMGAAIRVVDELQKEFVPRLFAIRPGTTREENLEGLNQIIKAMNLASPDLIDAAGNLTQSARRVLSAAQTAMILDPELQPNQIKTALANLKTAAYSMSEDALTRTLLNVGARGMRAANEAYMAQMVSTGTIDVKKVNNALVEMGLLQGARRNKQKNVEAGTGKATDEATLYSDPAKWYRENVVPVMNDAVAKTKEAQKRVAEARAAGKSAEEIAEAALPTDQEVTAFVHKKFAGASRSARQGIIDLLMADKQQTAAIEYGKRRRGEPIDPMIEKSAAAQWERVKTALTDRMDQLGEAAVRSLDLANVLKQVEAAIRDPYGKEATSLYEGAGRKALQAGLTMDPLNISAKLLSAAGIDLQAAAKSMLSGLADYFGIGQGGATPPTDAMGTPLPGAPEDQRSQTEQAIQEAANAVEQNAKQQTATQGAIENVRKQAEEVQRSIDSTADPQLKAALQATLAAQLDYIKSAQARLEQLQKTSEELKAKSAAAYAADAAAKATADKAAATAATTTAPEVIDETVKAVLHKVKLGLGKDVPPESRMRMKEVPLPMARPAAADMPEMPTDLGPTVDALKEAANSTNQSGEKFASSVSGLGTASSSFATAFDTGAVKLASAGKTAVADMESGAGAVGRLIAAAFVAGASGLKIGVDTSGVVQAKAGVDQGSQKASAMAA
ncbi:hypothetical protein CQ14_06850 [Bradyrhizobium lablabi]|uniref:Uncharacterized protein n=1 Tax=Bradyrhizobium lablabi TaxID=722472 RepID=A0A0R3MMB9_9BRAD|nr:hypothetical protein [Bradyrhizobium lablabi]KRR21362.1 hypothetical protein CQ14_06850 [Bradyrhizobium lablabi]